MTITAPALDSAYVTLTRPLLVSYNGKDTALRPGARVQPADAGVSDLLGLVALFEGGVYLGVASLVDYERATAPTLRFTQTSGDR